MRRLIPYLLVLIAAILGWRAEQGRRAALERIAQLEGQRTVLAVAPIPAAETLATPVPAAAETRAVRVPAGTDPVPYIKTIDELRELLREQAKTLSAARDAAARAEATLVSQEAEGKNWKAQMDELRELAQGARRLGDALQIELRAKSERLLKVETSEKLLRDRLARAESAPAKVAGVSREVEDLNRRREALLMALLRGYREVGDLYRNFALNAETRDGLQAGELSRIQTAIQRAEDDLRQLQALNARMARLARD